MQILHFDWLRYKRTIRNSHLVTKFVPGEQEWRSGESARLPPLCPGFVTRTRGQMWVEFVVDFLPSSEWFFSGYSAFLLSSETNISKIPIRSGLLSALCHEPLAQVNAQALAVFGIKFPFTFSFVFLPNKYFFNLHLLTLLLPFCTSSRVIPKQTLRPSYVATKRNARKITTELQGLLVS